MLFCDDIKKTMKKLGKVVDINDPGRIEIKTEGRAEERFNYYYGKQLVFTFGITRSSQKKSKQFRYVPRQMHLNNKNYKLLFECPKTKTDYNNELIQKGIIRS